jgi:hypothetical protein
MSGLISRSQSQSRSRGAEMWIAERIETVEDVHPDINAVE